MKKLNGKNWGEFKNQLFPSITVRKQNMLIDQSKILLNFLIHLVEILNTNINFREEYLSPAMKNILLNHEDKIVWRKQDYPQYAKELPELSSRLAPDNKKTNSSRC